MLGRKMGYDSMGDRELYVYETARRLTVSVFPLILISCCLSNYF